MATINESLEALMSIDGAKGTSIVDYTSGMVLGEAGSGIDMELAAAGNSEVVKAKLKTMKSLGLKDELEDILFTIATQYHVLRPLSKHKGLFIYLALNKEQANLALARRKVMDIESALEV